MYPEQAYEPSIEEKYLERARLDQTMHQRRLESEHELSGALIETEKDKEFPGYYKVVTDDWPKANIGPNEIVANKLIATSANYVAFAGFMLDVDLLPAQLFLINELSIDVNLSRAKGGWAGFLSKTSKSITESSLQEKAQQINTPQTRGGIFAKLRGR